METTDSQASIPERSRQRSSSSQGNRTWLWLLLSLLLLGGGGFMLWRVFNPGGAAQTAQQQPQAIPVQLQRIEQGTIEDSSEFVGTLQAQQGIDLRPKVEGRITQIYVTEGDTVRPGDPIAELSPERTRAELNAALANVNATLAAQSNAQAELRAAEAERISATADVELQNSEYERTSYLVAEGAQSQQLLDQVERDRNAAIAALQAAQERVAASRSTVEQANANYAQAQADAAAVRSDLEDTLVSAPIAGVVGDIPVKLGDYVSIGDPLTTITQNGTLELEVAIPIERRNQLRAGLPVEVLGLQGSNAGNAAANATQGGSASSNPGSPAEVALRNNARPVATGRISFVSPTVNTNSQSVLAKATFENPDGLLQDEQRIEARIVWQERPGVLIPVTAVTRLGGETFAYVAETQQNEQGESQMIARQRRVRLGSIQGNSYQVLEGVEPGEQLVVTGLLNLSDGVPIMQMPENAGQATPGQAPGGQAPQ
jgi:RND family efflux transporter MFP subunit